MRLATVTAFLALLFVPASAQNLVSGLSQDSIRITSNYTGTEIVVFGAVEGPQENTKAAPRDVIVVVRGPDADMTVRRKVRVAGIWINRDAMHFTGLPSYYYLTSTRPASAIALRATLQHYQIGLSYLQPTTESTHMPSKAEPFRQAAIRERENAHLYTERGDGVEFLSYSLFRARIPMPATAPAGHYSVEVYLLRNGTMLGANITPLYVKQIGLERGLFNFAHKQPFWYGIFTVLMAGLIGWGSSMVFRQA